MEGEVSPLLGESESLSEEETTETGGRARVPPFVSMVSLDEGASDVVWLLLVATGELSSGWVMAGAEVTMDWEDNGVVPSLSVALVLAGWLSMMVVPVVLSLSVPSICNHQSLQQESHSLSVQQRRAGILCCVWCVYRETIAGCMSPPSCLLRFDCTSLQSFFFVREAFCFVYMAISGTMIFIYRGWHQCHQSDHSCHIHFLSSVSLL